MPVIEHYRKLGKVAEVMYLLPSLTSPLDMLLLLRSIAALLLRKSIRIQVLLFQKFLVDRLDFMTLPKQTLENIWQYM